MAQKDYDKALDIINKVLEQHPDSAPALLAKVLGPINSPALTIGTDEGTASALNKMGARHVDCPVKEAVVDKENKIVSSPAYMLAGSISEAAAGIEKTVQELVNMIE